MRTVNNRIVDLGSPELGILASICEAKCKNADTCVEQCTSMIDLIAHIFELQKQAGYEVYDEDSLADQHNPMKPDTNLIKTMLDKKKAEKVNII